MRKAIKLEYKSNCYVLMSFHKKDDPYGEFSIRPTVSFFYAKDGVGAEWEVEYGPILMWYKADAPGDSIRDHYFWDYVLDRPLAWSQLAVQENALPQAAERNDLDYIFSVLARWAESNKVPYEPFSLEEEDVE